MSDAVSTNPKASIVVIDDERGTLELTRLVLTRYGYAVRCAENADEGIELISRTNPELVLMDYMMPGKDGLTALREIRQRFPDSYVVMFTGKGSEELAVELMKSGAAEYVVKPFNSKNLIAQLDNALKLRSIELDNRQLQQEHVRLVGEIDGWNRELQKRVQEKTEALNKAQSEIAQSEKLAALGYLSAGMAHEIRNPLNSIALFVQLMLQGDPGSEQREYLNKILKEIERVDAIIRKLLDVSRRTRRMVDNVMLDQVVETVLTTFTLQLETAEIQVRRDYESSLVPIKADPAELDQIVTNLLLNALDAMPQGGELSVQVCQENGRVAFRITDTGAGIAPGMTEQIFDPFFSTKAHGSGMGLPVVKRIAAFYQGRVVLEESRPGKTVFLVDFPVAG